MSTPKQIRLWRLVKSKHAETAFDGEGAFRYGGRWNSTGRRVVYASGSLSLAALEVLVHLDPAAPLPELCAILIDLSVKQIEVDHYSTLDSISGGLPWSLGQTRAWGDAWNQSQSAPALQVPSTIVPNESNYLLNPKHPSFAQLKIGEPEVFSLDTRLY